MMAQANREELVERPWAFDQDDGDITLHGCPVFKVYRADDFPCVEDEDRAEADMEYLAHAQVAVMLLNCIATTKKPTVGAAIAELIQAQPDRDGGENASPHRDPDVTISAGSPEAIASATRSDSSEVERLREALDDVREGLRVTMLEQRTTSERRTYTDGFAMGLCEAIHRIDGIDAAITVSGGEGE